MLQGGVGLSLLQFCNLNSFRTNGVRFLHGLISSLVLQ
ncbi:hypothetical protein BDA96_07G142200 [Sorghum bicolor]|uniref:Uncharacterized protein n=2 Tax=Sorghum bicolor TaxID=4558 RepID=A0A921UAI4_SORBI|nr:hypothetical protein BDA96_07G142200 [Sorghum bicolor]OQU83079.1 hypothetical protein SORBI_3005G072850 [Sorghum bicolor]